MKITEKITTKIDLLNKIKEYKSAPDDENIQYKKKIEKALLTRPDLLYALNEKSLETELFDDDGNVNWEWNNEIGEYEPLGEWERYFGSNSNIRPFLFIPDTQTEVKHYICYQVSFDEMPRYQDTLKYTNVTFTIFVHGNDRNDTATNAFLNLAVVETISATDAEIATADNGIVMPMIQIVKAGETLDITGFIEGSIHVNALSTKGSMGKDEFKKGSAASATEYAIKHTDEAKDPGDQHVTTPASDVLTPPIADGETQYIIKYKKTIKSGAKITNSGKKFPKSHELFFKALVVDKCETDVLKAAIIHIPSFMPSPEFSLALQGGDSQTMDYKGSMMLNACSTDAELFSIYYIDEEEDDIEL